MHHLLNRRFAIYRRTGLILESVAVGAVAADRTPDAPYHVELEANAAAVGSSGSIRVTGTVGGAGATEDLDFRNILTAGGKARLTTTSLWDENTAVSFGIQEAFAVSTTMSAQAVQPDGSLLKQLYLVQAAWPGRIDRKHGAWGMPRDGSAQREKPYVFFPRSSSYVPQEGDEIVESQRGRRWRIESLPELDDFTDGHHWECPLQPQETTP